MVHYVNEYFELGGHAGELEKVAVLRTQVGTAEIAKFAAKVAKSFTEVEVDRLNQVIALEKK